MAPRGLSKEEKRVKMMEIFHENGEFFSFKELEKIAPKQKGIVQQSVKDVLEELKSDGLVMCEKIGTGVYYWSFPSAAGAQKQAALARITAEMSDVDTRLAETGTQLKATAKGREDTPDRRALLEALTSEQSRAHTLKAELDARGAADPLTYERKRAAAATARSAAERWIDNTWTVLAEMKKLGAEDDTLRQYLGLAEDWDDLEAIGK